MRRKAYKQPHRCMTRLDEWIEQRHASALGPRRRKRCQRRATFYVGDEPVCVGCGRSDGWRVEKKHRRKDRERETCKSGMCPLWYPHSIHSEECVHNPRRDDLTGELTRVRARGDEIPF